MVSPKLGGTTLGLASQLTQLNKTMKALTLTTSKLASTTNMMGIVMKSFADVLNIKPSVSQFKKDVQVIKTGLKALFGERRGKFYSPRGSKRVHTFYSIQTKKYEDFLKEPLTKGQKVFKVLKKGLDYMIKPLSGGMKFPDYKKDFNNIRNGLIKTGDAFKSTYKKITGTSIKQRIQNIPLNIQQRKADKLANRQYIIDQNKKLLTAGLGAKTIAKRWTPMPFKYMTTKERMGHLAGRVGGKISDIYQSTKGKSIAGTLFKSPFKLLGGELKLVGKAVSKLTGIPSSKFVKMGKAFKSMGGVMKGAGLGMLVGVLYQLLAAFNPLKPLITAITTIVSIWGTILGTSLTPLIQKLYDVMLSPKMISLWERLANVVFKAFEALMPIIDIAMPFVDIILEAFIVALEALVPLFPLIQTPLEILASLVRSLSPLLNLFLIPLQILGHIFEAFAPVIALILLPMQLLSDIFPVIGTGITKFMGWIDDLMTSINDGIDNLVSGVKNILNGIFMKINDVIEGINEATGWSIATIPMLANGGIVTSPTILEAGEDGAEAIVPLEKMGGMGNITINIYGYVSDEMIVELDEKLEEYRSRKRLF
ncbi:MAG: hypothetical protein ACTSR3_01210 [Candidatus Helarchaeota archaeon]